MTEIRMHDVVALREEVPAQHFETGRPLMLSRGEVGTIVMTFDAPVVEVEFSDSDGCAYAMVAIAIDKLLSVRERPDSAT